MPTQTNDRPLDIYVRVSQVGGRDVEAEGGTASEQERRCRAQATADGLEVGKVFIDLDQSGGKTSRPQYDKVLDRIKTGASGGVIVYNLKRFGRRSGFAQTIIDIEQAGARFISCQEKLDTTTPSGRFMIRILASIAEMELEQLTEDWLDRRARTVARGIHIGPPPAGYSRNGERTLHPNEHAHVVRETYVLRSKGSSWLQCAQHLSDNGVETSRGSTNWSIPGVKALLSNEAYLGVIRSGEFRLEGAHDAIVDPSLFRRVQATFQHRDATPRQDRSPLKRILRCASCGNAMALDHNDRGGFYRCRNRGACESKPTISSSMIEDYVFGLVAEQLPEFDSSEKAVDMAELELAVESAHAELVAFTESTSVADIGAELYKLGIDKRRAVHAEALAAFNEAAPTEGIDLGVKSIEHLRAQPTKVQQAVLAQLFERITVARGSGLERVEVVERV